jgi:hypothetical protein
VASVARGIEGKGNFKPAAPGRLMGSIEGDTPMRPLRRDAELNRRRTTTAFG